MNPIVFLRLHRYAMALSLLLMSVTAKSQTDSVQQAIAFLKTACVTSGSSLDIKVGADGTLKLSKLLGTGVEGSISLNKKEAEGFADAASSLSAQQASEMRACMKPYIDKVLDSLLSPQRPASTPSTTSSTPVGQVTPALRRTQIQLQGGVPARSSDELTATLLDINRQGATLVVNGHKVSHLHAGRRLVVSSATNQSCFVEVMEMSPADATPVRMTLDHVCSPRRR